MAGTNWPERPKSLSERGYRKYMAKTKEITIGEQKFTLQSVSPSWYYVDGMFKNCVVAPAEVKANGMEYFDDNEDLKTAEKLIAAIEQFLRS